MNNGKRIIYVFIIAFGVSFTMLIYFFIVCPLQQRSELKEAEKNAQIELLKEQSKERADSLITIVDSTTRASDERIESLAERVKLVKIKAVTETKKLLKRYDDEFKAVDSLLDDSVDAVHKQCRDRHDHLFSN